MDSLHDIDAEQSIPPHTSAEQACYELLADLRELKTVINRRIATGMYFLEHQNYETAALHFADVGQLENLYTALDEGRYEDARQITPYLCRMTQLEIPARLYRY